ncbi:methyltransferase domain-containing protein [Marinoscillum sp. 108]|uniref:methyltransferase domain-containing protein n=1 Tax=Marinoscillum sp. 108 TaxID=2653151 RepID=UPI0012F05D1F|nr:methyltransferase domain-containing protein [Marinoscillum sp. 108]VXD17381.1 Methyltransferase family protein [Marinoscillum sp. 108]
MTLKHRSEEMEIMDDLSISGEVIGQTLRELDIINRRLGGNHISLRAFAKILKNHRIQTVADLGCGGADILMAMARIAKRKNQDIQFTGVDANQHIVEYANDHTREWANISIIQENILSEAFRRQHFDIIHCCLFLHHFTESQLISIFKSLKDQARVAIIVNDLHRHILAFHSIRLLTRFFSKSYMVRNDAAISVARGFKKSELAAILEQAGISNYQLSWRWAFRWQLVIHK